MTDPQLQKSLIRKSIRDRLRALAPDDRQQASSQACRLLAAQSVWTQAASILFYAPLRDELDLWPLVSKAMSQGKTAALPRFDPKTGGYSACQLVSGSEPGRGAFGVREPAADLPAYDAKQLDLILVPGVAFDRCGGRVGRGKGFYDRFLINAGGVKCGVAFDEQIVEAVPMEPHDIPLNWILTPTRWLETGSAPALK